MNHLVDIHVECKHAHIRTYLNIFKGMKSSSLSFNLFLVFLSDTARPGDDVLHIRTVWQALQDSLDGLRVAHYHRHISCGKQWNTVKVENILCGFTKYIYIICILKQLKID